MASELHDLPLKVAALMRGFGRSWFIAGGWAVDLYLGELTRPHEDVEVAVFREDQAALREHFGVWSRRKKDERDFEAVAARLDGERRAWLRGAREVCDAGHPWLRKLAG